MLRQVIITPIMDTFKLLETEWETVLDIPGRLGVKNEILMLMPTQIFRLKTEIKVILKTLRAPFLINRRRRFRSHEILHFHLFEFTLPEDELSRRDLIAERLADLCDAERHLDPG